MKNVGIVKRIELIHDNDTIIDPTDYKVDRKSRFCLYSNIKKEYIFIGLVDTDELITINDNDDENWLSYKFKFQIFENKRWHDYTKLENFIPKSFNVIFNTDIISLTDDLKYTERNNCTLYPYFSLRKSGFPIGIAGAYENEKFVPESIHLVLGKQADMVIPYTKPEEIYNGTVIFAGLPNSSFGHFLTEGLSPGCGLQKNIRIFQLSGLVEENLV
ncbi:MAG: hypothetical protein J0647_01820 [Campylobacteraceae bacterium]|nr:hypothetical protein [Campylobacteraceae bacterium]